MIEEKEEMMKEVVIAEMTEEVVVEIEEAVEKDEVVEMQVVNVELGRQLISYQKRIYYNII